MAKIIIFLTAFLVSNLNLCFSQTTETITLTTYYPSPYGVYKTLRLFPSTRSTSRQEGDLYYDDGTGLNSEGVYYCDTALGVSTWKSFGGLWTLSGTDLFANSTDYDVGIGTTTPNAKLEVSGNAKFNNDVIVSGKIKDLNNKEYIKCRNTSKDVYEAMGKVMPVGCDNVCCDYKTTARGSTQKVLYPNSGVCVNKSFNSISFREICEELGYAGCEPQPQEPSRNIRIMIYRKANCDWYCSKCAFFSTYNYTCDSSCTRSNCVYPWETAQSAFAEELTCYKMEEPPCCP